MLDARGLCWQIERYVRILRSAAPTPERGDGTTTPERLVAG